MRDLKTKVNGRNDQSSFFIKCCPFTIDQKSFSDIMNMMDQNDDPKNMLQSSVNKKEEKILDRLGHFIARHKGLILIIGFLLLIPSVIGTVVTRVNYDLLSYLPNTLETVNGQDIMVDQFGMGAFALIVVKDMELKDAAKLEKKIEKIDHVEDVLWYDDVADLNLPVSMIPKKIRKAFFTDDATLMIALIDDTTSSDAAMNCVADMRKVVSRNCFISGMSGVVNDIKDIALEELPVYVVIAAVLSLLVLELTMDSLLVPLFFLIGIGMAILYNLGTNIFLGQVSYITKALTAVLQLGVTMDYSIFLLHSFEEFQEEYEDKTEAMGHAITATFKSIVGSSVTTVAGFAALCFMTFALGRDLGIVMAKGVIIGVATCVTILPSMILVFDKPIEKTRHRPLIQSRGRLTGFIIRFRWVFILAFAIMLYPAIYGNNHVGVYYNIAHSLPDDLDCNVATKQLEEIFHMNTVHMVMMDRNLDARKKREMAEETEEVDGVKWCISMSSFFGPMIPESMIPAKFRKMLQSDQYELAFVGSEYGAATPEVNRQVGRIQEISKNCDPSSMVIGEAPMMKDLEEVTNVDIRNVNIASAAAIFFIILIVFRSVSLPVILVAVIEFAIMVNMAVPYYQGETLPFVASIVIGTIQLGATVDYAIVFTTRYIRERQAGHDKFEAVRIAHDTNLVSIFTSAMSLFAATFGVAVYSRVDMIGAICTLLARGAVLSMIIVLTLLPALILLFDKLICKTTMGMGHLEN